MDYPTLIIRLSAATPQWREYLKTAENLTRERFNGRLHSGRLMEEPTFTTLCNFLDNTIAELEAIRAAMVPKATQTAPEADPKANRYYVTPEEYQGYIRYYGSEEETVRMLAASGRALDPDNGQWYAIPSGWKPRNRK